MITFAADFARTGFASAKSKLSAFSLHRPCSRFASKRDQ